MICLFLLCGCASEKPKEEEPVIETEEVKEEKTAETADIDLSFGSETIAYAVITNILEDPESYLDQKVKMPGTFRQFYSETYGMAYYVCVSAMRQHAASRGWNSNLRKDWMSIRSMASRSSFQVRPIPCGGRLLVCIFKGCRL